MGDDRLVFGTRADLVVDLTLVTNVVAPVVALASLRFVRRRRYNAHRLFQITLLVVCVLAVVALEVRIRLAGGSGALVSRAPANWLGVARAVLAVHISVAVLTYLAWGWLAVVSSRRYMANLPGTFSSRHRRVGWLVFAGLCFNAISAMTMYFVTFAA
ncbi:MAG: DUF420 domain-containing protein [Kofleriaceae bacterium]|nr:DUF420 domain-containing protein [Kofleriaceae bacterium]